MGGGGGEEKTSVELMEGGGDDSEQQGLVGAWGSTMLKGWDEMLEKTRTKMEEAKATSLARMEEARELSERKLAEARELSVAKMEEWKLDELKAGIAAKLQGGEPSSENDEENPADRARDDDDDDDHKAEDASLLGLVGMPARLPSFRGGAESLKGLAAKVGDESMKVGANVKTLAAKVGDGGKDLAKQFSSSVADTRECGLSRAQRFRAYVILLVASTFFFGLAFQFLLSPAKFATAFSFGTLTSLAAKAMLNGPYTQLRLMVSLRRLPYTITLLATTGLTLYFTFSRANFLVVLVAAVANVAALLYYLFADTPGGKQGIKLLFKLILNSLRLIAKPFLYAFE